MSAQIAVQAVRGLCFNPGSSTDFLCFALDPRSDFRPDSRPDAWPDARPWPGGDELASQITHELRGPLYALNGWLHLLTAERPLTPDQTRRAAQGARLAVETQIRQIDALGRVLRHLFDSTPGQPPRDAKALARKPDGVSDDQTPAVVCLEEVLSGLRACLESDADGLGPGEPEQGWLSQRLRIQEPGGSDGASPFPFLQGEADELIQSLWVFVALGLRHAQAASPLSLDWELDPADGAGNRDGGVGRFCELVLRVDEGSDPRSIWQAFGGTGTALSLELLAAVLGIESSGGRVWPGQGPSGGWQLHVRLPVASGQRAL